MINIFEKDGATIITIENPTQKEKDLIKEAYEVKNTARAGGVFSKFKCNQRQASHECEQLDMWQTISDDMELPFEQKGA